MMQIKPFLVVGCICLWSLGLWGNGENPTIKVDIPRQLTAVMKSQLRGLNLQRNGATKTSLSFYVFPDQLLQLKQWGIPFVQKELD